MTSPEKAAALRRRLRKGWSGTKKTGLGIEGGENDVYASRAFI